jgi:hypothetical protein
VAPLSLTTLGAADAPLVKRSEPTGCDHRAR